MRKTEVYRNIARIITTLIALSSCRVFAAAGGNTNRSPLPVIGRMCGRDYNVMREGLSNTLESLLVDLADFGSSNITLCHRTEGLYIIYKADIGDNLAVIAWNVSSTQQQAPCSWEDGFTGKCVPK